MPRAGPKITLAWQVRLLGATFRLTTLGREPVRQADRLMSIPSNGAHAPATQLVPSWKWQPAPGGRAQLLRTFVVALPIVVALLALLALLAQRSLRRKGK